MADPSELLKRVFGFDQFRGVQREVIDRVLAGRHTLAVMPPGAGKSLCYHLPALARNAASRTLLLAQRSAKPWRLGPGLVSNELQSFA